MSHFCASTQRFTLLFTVALLLVFPLPSFAHPIVSVDQLSTLLGATSQKVTEIRLAREKANELGFKLAIYGGTSRELIDFVTRKIEILGGVDQYQRWLAGQERIHLLDFHKIQSDLDFQVIPRIEPTEEHPLSEADRRRYQEFENFIAKEFPGNVFYTKMDLNLSSEFFGKYAPDSEHFEAISNIPISENGIEKPAALDVTIDGRRKNLAEWGAEQYLRQELDFRRLLRVGGKEDIYGDFRQALRWLRYISENPHMKLTRESASEIQQLLAPLLSTHRDQLKIYLQGQGDLGMKSLQALEKLQLYSKDSLKTRKLLDDYGITALAEEAGVKASRILEPLRSRSSGQGTGERLGREVTINHRTSLAAAQNSSLGARWISNNVAMIGGKTTMAVHGDGIYGKEGALSASYGDIYVAYVLSADAIRGVDFDQVGDIYIIKTLNAIARHPDGRYKIDEVDMNFIQRDFLDKLANHPELTEAEKQSIIRGLASILQPEIHESEVESFFRVMEEAKKIGLSGVYLSNYLQKPGALARMLEHKTAFSKAFLPSIHAFVQRWGRDGLAAISHGIAADPRVLEHPQLIPSLFSLTPEDRKFLFQRGALVAAIADTLKPESNEVGGRYFKIMAEEAKSSGSESAFLTAYLERPGTLRSLMEHKTDFARNFFKNPADFIENWKSGLEVLLLGISKDPSLLADRAFLASLMNLRDEHLHKVFKNPEIIRALSNAFHPETDPAHRKDFERLLETSHRLGYSQKFLGEFFSRPGVLASLARHETEFAREFFPSTKDFSQKWGKQGLGALAQGIYADPSALKQSHLLDQIYALPESEVHDFFASHGRIGEAIASVLHPESSAADGEYYERLLQEEKRLNPSSRLIHILFNRPGFLAALLHHGTPFSKRFFRSPKDFVQRNFDGLQILSHAIVNDASVLGHRDFLPGLMELPDAERTELFSHIEKAARQSIQFHRDLDRAISHHPVVRQFMRAESSWRVAPYLSSYVEGNDAMAFILHQSLGWKRAQQADSDVDFVKTLMEQAPAENRRRVYDSIFRGSDFGAGVGARSEAFHHGIDGGLKALTANDRAMIQLALEVGDKALIRDIILQTKYSDVKKYLIQQALYAPDASIAGELLVYYPLPPKEKALVQSELRRNTAGRSHLAWVLLQQSPSSLQPLAAIPWNRNSPEDILALAELDRKATLAYESMRSAILDIKRKAYGADYQLQPYEDVTSYDEHYAQDSALVERYRQQRDNHWWTQRVLNDSLSQAKVDREMLQNLRARTAMKLVAGLKSFFPWTRKWAAQTIAAYHANRGAAELSDPMTSGLQEYQRTRPIDCERALREISR